MALGQVLVTSSRVKIRVKLCSHSERMSVVLSQVAHFTVYCPRPAYFKLRPRILIDFDLKHDFMWLTGIHNPMT